MNDSQRALRRAAAEAFSQSLDQLAVCFEPEEANLVAQSPDSPITNPAPKSSVKQSLSQQLTQPPSHQSPSQLQALEDAAADIEQLFQQASL